MSRKQLDVIDGGVKEEGGGERKESQRIGDFVVPRNYELWKDGLYHVEGAVQETEQPTLAGAPSQSRRGKLSIVARRPIWIKRFGAALDTKEELLELAFIDRAGTVKTEWVSRQQLSTKILLVRLARAGLPVHDENAKALIYYLDSSIYINGSKLPCVKVAGRSGAYKVEEGHGWLVGDKWIGPPDTSVVVDPRKLHTIARGFGVEGSEAAWITKWQEVCQLGPLARWLCYSTFAAPLLRFVRTRTFIVHQWGPTGGGKSGVLKLALSAWGDPQLLMTTFNRTEKSFSEIFHYVDDLPVGFDELQASMAKDHAQIIYALTLEHGRGRAQKEGGLQSEIESWRTVIRTTGEEPIIGKGGIVDLGGQANRVVQIGTPVLTSDQAKGIHQWCEERHFGWGGLRFLEGLRTLVNQEGGVEYIKALYDRIYAAVSAATIGEMHTRDSHISCGALAEALAMIFFYGTPDEEAVVQAITDAIAVAASIQSEEVSETLAEQALQLITDNFVADRKAWHDMSQLGDRESVCSGIWSRMTGVLHHEEVWMVQKSANDLLRRAGLPPRRVWADFKRLGILWTQNEREFSSVKTAGKFKSRVYVLVRAKCPPFTGDDNA